MTAALRCGAWSLKGVRWRTTGTRGGLRAQGGLGHASFYSFWHALTSLACYAGLAVHVDRKYRQRVRAGMPASLGDVLDADAVVPVAGEQAEAGSATSRRVRGPGALAQRSRFMAHTSINDIN